MVHTQTSQKAVLVFGPESSGTRLWTRIFVEAGCYGDYDHVQRLDVDIPVVPALVWRRSFPHMGVFPDVKDMVERLDWKGYESCAVVTARDPSALCASQVATGHVETVAAAKDRSRHAYHLIFAAAFKLDLPATVVTYESLLIHPAETLRKLLKAPLVVPKDLSFITNENAKRLS